MTPDCDGLAFDAHVTADDGCGGLAAFEAQLAGAAGWRLRPNGLAGRRCSADVITFGAAMASMFGSGLRLNTILVSLAGGRASRRPQLCAGARRPLVSPYRRPKRLSRAAGNEEVGRADRSRQQNEHAGDLELVAIQRRPEHRPHYPEGSGDLHQSHPASIVPAAADAVLGMFAIAATPTPSGCCAASSSASQRRERRVMSCGFARQTGASWHLRGVQEGGFLVIATGAHSFCCESGAKKRHPKTSAPTHSPASVGGPLSKAPCHRFVSPTIVVMPDGKEGKYPFNDYVNEAIEASMAVS
jgi:hypothetical protein